jgi:phage terminase large subunit-like protein
MKTTIKEIFNKMNKEIQVAVIDESIPSYREMQLSNYRDTLKNSTPEVMFYTQEKTINKSFKTLLNLRDKVLNNMDVSSYPSNLSDGYLEIMVEDYGYTYTKTYLKGLL